MHGTHAKGAHLGGGRVRVYKISLLHGGGGRFYGVKEARKRPPPAGQRLVRKAAWCLLCFGGRLQFGMKVSLVGANGSHVGKTIPDNGCGFAMGQWVSLVRRLWGR